MIDFIMDNALIINKNDFGEADRYITVFSENFGKLTFLLKGVRKSKKRELSSVDILSLTRFNFYRKKESYIVNSFTGVDSYLELKKDLDNLGIALYFLALLNAILVENNRKKSLYEITLKSLNYLKESKDKKDNYILIGYYLYYLIKDEGLKIQLGNGYNFSYEKSIFLVENERYTSTLTEKEKEIMQLFISNGIKILLNGDYQLENIEKVVSIFEKYINFHLGINIKLKNYMMEG